MGHELGRLREEMVLNMICTARDKALAWILRARLAHDHEDRRGIDIVVTTVDAGMLYVQVKSSRDAARKWRALYFDTPVFARSVLVLFQPDAIDATAEALRDDLVSLRDRILAGRDAA